MNLLAIWREAGEWWAGEPYREVRRFIDPKGIRREEETLLPTLGKLNGGGQEEYEEDNTIEVTERARKRADISPPAPGGESEPKRAGEGMPAWNSPSPEPLSPTPLSSGARTSPQERGAHPPFLLPTDDCAGGRRKGAGGMEVPEASNQAEPLSPTPLSSGARTSPQERGSYFDRRLRESEYKASGTGYAFGKKVKMPHREARRDDWGMLTGYSGIRATQVAQSTAPPYVPLHVHSGYAFGRGTMLTEEIPLIAASFGLTACAITDPFSLVGAVEFHKACRKHGLKPLIGATFEMPEGGELVLIARTKLGYRNLSQLVSACHLEEPRQFPLCSWERLERYRQDLICLTGGDTGPLNRYLIRRDFAAAESLVQRLKALFGQDLFIEVEESFLPWQHATNRLLLELAEKEKITPVAGGRVTHARPEDFPVQDILTCIDTLCLVDEVIGRKTPRDPRQPQASRAPERALNAERYLRTPEEMSRLHQPELLASTLIVAERCEEDILPGRTELPSIFEDDPQALREITMMGAYRRHDKLAPKLKKRIQHELKRIIDLGYARHFLAAYDMVRWADEHEIQYSGRGSVVDSAVAFCLGFSRIDAYKHNLHFDRFLPVDGSKRPDIDIDFEARHRDDVREYLTRKYGRDHVATVAAIGAYCTRGIVREVGKALGLPNETIGFLAKRIHGGVPAHQLESALEQRPELRGSHIPKERFRWVFQLAERMMDVPRNMRAHSSGVIISSRPIWETVPVMWSASSPNFELHPSEDLRPETAGSLRICQWDKRSCKHFFDKFDVLCLRGQDVLAGTENRVRVNSADFSVTRIPTDDPETYRAMRSGELIGIPQSASPAMRQAHIRLKTENLHDASLVQAGIRPGVGGAVKLNQLIARRLGKEEYSFEHPELEKILGHTYGIIVFQEQVDQLLQTFCGFTSGQAEDLRDSIYKKRREDFAKEIQEEMLRTILGRGFSRVVAEKVVEYVVGFKGYGFAEGHALAFAEVSIRSIYCQQNFPSEYFAALLSAQPAGYYGPCTIVNEARGRGVVILQPDVNASEEEFSVEDVRADGMLVPGGAIRVALQQISSLSDKTRKRILAVEREVAVARGERERVALKYVPYQSGGTALMVAESSPFLLPRMIVPGEEEGGRGDGGSTGVPPVNPEPHSSHLLPRMIVPGQEEAWGISPPAPGGESEPERAGEGMPAWNSPSPEPLSPTPLSSGARTSPQERGAHPPFLLPTDDCAGGRRKGAGGMEVPETSERAEPLSPTPLSSGARTSPQERGAQRFRSFFDFAAKVRPNRDELEQLILCGAFDSLHPNRRALLWAIPAALDYAKQLDEDALPLEMPEPELPQDIDDFTTAEKAIHDRRVLGLDVTRHLMSYERERVASRGGITSEAARRLPAGRKEIVVGNPIRLRFPPTASGKRVVFFDLEDETGLLNVTCFDDVYQRDGHAIVCSPYVTIIGEAQDRDGHTAFLAHRVFAYNPTILAQVQVEKLPITVGDFLVG